MTHAAASPRRRILALACIGLAATLISPLDGPLRTEATALPASVAATSAAGTAASTTATAAALTAAAAPSPAHPFSDPVYSPFRTPVVVNCVRTNCKDDAGAPYHGVWAIDFIDTNHSTFEPLYAAGAGIFHIGAVIGANTCSTTGVASSGTWVWIDHGGGRTTRYTHLYDVLAVEGQLVTPTTIIGRMGHNGNRAPCTLNYVHIEYRLNGLTNPTSPPPSMRACVGTGSVLMPSQGLRTAQGVGKSYAAWNDVPSGNPPGLKLYTPTATNNCLATNPAAATPARPIVSSRPGPASATIGWGVVPAGVDHTVVTIETWHPSLNRYGSLVQHQVAGRAATKTVTGLLNGRLYRLRAATHNAAGYSAWTSYANVTPAAVPALTRAPRLLSTTRDAIRYAWWLPANNGRAITRFQVARRCVVGGSWTGWAYTGVPGHVVPTSWNLHYNWTGMPRGRACEVTVRAVNSVGYGPWSVRSRATTLR